MFFCEERLFAVSVGLRARPSSVAPGCYAALHTRVGPHESSKSSGRKTVFSSQNVTLITFDASKEVERNSLRL